MMLNSRLSRPAWRGAPLFATLLFSSPAWAGNGANFVLYNHHTEERGETEVQVFNDFANVGHDGEDYTAQLYEIEHGVTDFWTTAVYLETTKVEREDFEFASFRFENRVRLFDYGTFLNPVLYVEYEHLKPNSRYIRVVTGRTDGEEAEEGEGGEEEEEIENELETKLILGHDFSNRFNVAFNWINEVNLKTGDWEFGYALGVNYVLVGGDDEEHEGREQASQRRWDLEKITLGGELYGGIGDDTLGLTLDSGKTQRYLGINLKAEFENHVHVGIGGAFGLTKNSEDALLRLNAGYEFE